MKLLQWLKLKPQFEYKGIKFYDFESVKALETLLSDVADEAVRKYLVKEVQNEMYGIKDLTPEIVQEFQARIDKIETTVNSGW